jgi:hypothetical protein
VLTLRGADYLAVIGQGKQSNPEADGTLLYSILDEEWIVAEARPSYGNHHSAEVIDNRLYLFGGVEEGGTDVQIGSLTAGADGQPQLSWVLGAPIPFAAGSANTAYIHGLVRPCSHSAPARSVQHGGHAKAAQRRPVLCSQTMSAESALLTLSMRFCSTSSDCISSAGAQGRRG